MIQLTNPVTFFSLFFKLKPTKNIKKWNKVFSFSWVKLFCFPSTAGTKQLYKKPWGDSSSCSLVNPTHVEKVSHCILTQHSAAQPAIGLIPNAWSRPPLLGWRSWNNQCETFKETLAINSSSLCSEDQRPLHCTPALIQYQLHYFLAMQSAWVKIKLSRREIRWDFCKSLCTQHFWCMISVIVFLGWILNAITITFRLVVCYCFKKFSFTAEQNLWNPTNLG